MGFSIDHDFGPFGIFIVVMMIGAGVIAVTWLLAAARQDRQAVLEEEADVHPSGPDL